MSAAFRMSLRAGAKPVRAIRQTPHAPAIGYSSRRLATYSSSRLVHQWGGLKTRSWKYQGAEQGPLAALSKQSYATSTSALFSAETQGQSNEESSKTGQLHGRWIKTLIVLGGLGVGAVAFSDELKHAYYAACRSGRVVGTLAVCINE